MVIYSLPSDKQRCFLTFSTIPNDFRRFRKITKFRNICLSGCPSLSLPAWNNTAPNGRIFMNYEI